MPFVKTENKIYTLGDIWTPRSDGHDLPPLIRRNPGDQPEVPPISFTSYPDGRIQYDMHSAPPREEQEFFLNAMRIVAQPHQQSSNTTPPINPQIYPTARRQLRDALPNADPLFLPLPSSSTSPSSTQPRTQRTTPHTTGIYAPEIYRIF